MAVKVTPLCKEELRPFVGKSFNSLDAAISFYEEYAKEVGFDPRKSGKKTSGNVITWQYLVCSREGVKQLPYLDTLNAEEGGSSSKRRRVSKRCECEARISFKFVSDCGVVRYVVQQFVEEHNHSMVEPKYKHFMKVNRNIDFVHLKFAEDCVKANIGPTMTFNLLKEVMGGYDVVGCTVTDMRNMSRDMKSSMEGYDVEMVLTQMRMKKELCDGFYYAYELDSADKLTRLFWSDASSRRNYHMFGDVVSFNTSYSTNRYCMIFAPFTGKDNHGCSVTFAAGFLSHENIESFSWLLTHFVECMGAHPRLIIKDQDPAMKPAIENVLSGTRHRWCMWHIMMKVSEKVPKSLFANEFFKKDLNSCVWSDLLEPEEFEES